ncbi:MAG: DUF3592 domain-containing protein [Desulfuromusa sp.]|nr:DUF3592 domain-containing protein [Desulfuromusa sp.]
MAPILYLIGTNCPAIPLNKKLSYFKLLPQKTRKAMQTPSTPNTYVKTSPMFLVLLAGIIILGYGLWNVYRGYESKTWPTTTGTIITSRIAGSTRIIGRKAFIKYDYLVDNKSYTSQLVSYTWKCVDYAGSMEILREFPQDKQVVVYYNPSDPNDAVLRTAISGRISWLFLFGTLTMLIGLRGLQWQKRRNNIETT